MTTIHDILNFRPQRFQGGQQPAWQPFGGLQPFGGQPSQPMPPQGGHGGMFDVFHGMFPSIGMSGQGGMSGLQSGFGQGVNQAGMGEQGSSGMPTKQFGNTPWKLPDISGFLRNFQQRQPSPYSG